MEAECLLYDLPHAPQLLFRSLQIIAFFLAEIGALVKQKKQIVDRFKRIVQLVRDGCGNSPGSGQLFTCSERLFSPPALSNIAEREHRPD